MTIEELENIKDKAERCHFSKEDVLKLVEEIKAQTIRLNLLEKELSHLRCIPRLSDIYAGEFYAKSLGQTK